MDFSKYFKTPIQVKKTDKGLTNLNFFTDNGYVIKQYSNHVANFEINNIALVKDFDVPLYHIDKEVKITSFVKGSTFEDVDYSVEKVQEVAKILKNLHNSKIIGKNDFDPFKNLEIYLKDIKKEFYDYSKYSKYITEAKKIHKESEFVFCHNDLTPGNFLFTKDKSFLIDWEYSGNNDPLFDVASFLNENNLYDTKYKDIFFKEYFGNKNIPHTKLQIWNNFQNLMWCVWANMMFEKTNKEIYVKIAAWKKANLDKEFTI